MDSKSRCNAKTKEGHRCQRQFRKPALYFFQHERILGQHVVTTAVNISSELVTIENPASDSESTTSSDDFELRPKTPCFHETARNEILGNLELQNSENPNIKQCFSSVNNVYNREPRKISNCQVYIENLITHLAPVLSDQAEMVESLTKGATFVGLKESNDSGRASDGYFPSLKDALRNLSKPQDTTVAAESRKIALQEIAQRLAKIASLLRTASNICQSTKRKDHFSNAGRGS
ncbi:hypothetical protein P170DRAFT_476007 [Aspergillus steynii IBT 23096]|uniref:Uncharacterized protein n=1 Tax=Aspergillus steynii IBT 23096 TaxID=1392250 RepID=A0A2I2GA14_9EURO|nr:uncharacterized protein P170DRAFT_476007 [Aspergillus steynii IBT 23096]PLB49721.1 hypothetical protein P170DRAFT_476007 [Aspergillus steynii IBT 23096]